MAPKRLRIAPAPASWPSGRPTGTNRNWKQGIPASRLNWSRSRPWGDKILDVRWHRLGKDCLSKRSKRQCCGVRSTWLSQYEGCPD